MLGFRVIYYITLPVHEPIRTRFRSKSLTHYSNRVPRGSRGSGVVVTKSCFGRKKTIRLITGSNWANLRSFL